MCCSSCFFDLWLREYVARQATSIGVCGDCGALDVSMVECASLKPLFEDVIEVYLPSEAGKPLAQLLQDDWLLFAGTPEQMNSLLHSIIGEAASKTYEPKIVPGAETAVIGWSALREELKHKNRFFPENAPNRDEFTFLVNNLARSEVPNPLFRARVIKGGRCYTASEMGAPPADLVGDGRANPTGIPYLYLAGDINTAISEVRPAKHDKVAVAEFSIATPLRLIDLSNPRMTISPFSVPVEAVVEIRGSLDFLAMLGEELSTPTLPHRHSTDYLASQYLCELIKSIGYDGVMYKSAQTGGANVTLFDPRNANCVSVSEYRVEDCRFDYRELPAN